jgi:2-keto-4-pentenoate hydratase
MEHHERERAAAELAEAERDRRPIEALTERWPDMSVVDAYEIQLANIRRRVDGGASVRGHKVGLSSRAMQQMMGVNEPDYGHLLHDMFIYEHAVVDATRYCAPRVEVEVGFILGEALSGPDCTVADVLRATEYVVPAIELIDSRIVDWKIKLPDTIADNASSAGVVLGARPVRLESVDVRLLGAVLRKNGSIVTTGAAGAVLGNPVTAVAWLANKVHSFGVTLEAGHVVLPGSCTRAVDIGPGDVIVADFEALGRVSVTFGPGPRPEVDT